MQGCGRPHLCLCKGELGLLTPPNQPEAIAFDRRSLGEVTQKRFMGGLHEAFHIRVVRIRPHESLAVLVNSPALCRRQSTSAEC